jgi:hypothetical protein
VPRFLQVLALALVIAVNPDALEIGLYGGLSNLEFARDRTSDQTELPATYTWTGSAHIAHELGPVELDLVVAIDPVLRNIAHLTLGHASDYFAVTFGAFAGGLISGGFDLWPGLSAHISLYAPRLLFASLSSEGSLSFRPLATSGYLQQQNRVEVGFFGRNVNPAVYVESRRFTLGTSDGSVVDSLVEYGVEADCFEKNVAFGLLLSGAYQDWTKRFAEATTVTHRYGSIVGTVNCSIVLFRRLTVTAQLETSVFTFGLGALLGESSSDRFLFRARLGTSYRL